MKNSKIIAGLLLILPLSLLADTASDRQIENAFESSYNCRVVLNHQVKVSVNDGVATLTGKVATEEQSRIAEDTVSGQPGVVRVDNKLKVKGAQEGSDEWIALKVRSRLLVKSNVSLANTKVEVKNGVVTLTGKADNLAQKDLTESYVNDIEGVRSVQNEIVVSGNETGIDQSMRRDTLGEKLDDSSITAQVKYELFSHRSTSALKTTVNTNNGHVIISGDAASDAEKDLVTKLAKSVRGVESVDNNMTVRN